MKKRNAGLVLLLGSLLFVGFGAVKAQNNGANGPANRLLNMSDEDKAAKKDEIKGNVENRWETVTCKKVETRMRTRYQKYETNKALHKQTYANMVVKINKIITDYKALGYDVSALEADLVTLEAKLQTLYADHEALIQNMKEAELGACSSTKEGLSKKIQETKQYRLSTIKTDILAIRTFYSTVLRPDLVALVQQVKTSTSPTVSPTTVAN